MLQSKSNSYLSILCLVLAYLTFSPEVHAQDKKLRDPTLPSGQYQAVKNLERNPTIVLNSIVTGPSTHAVINNKIVNVGDTIQGVKVVKISSSQVTLSDGRKLQLFQSVTER